eukprot:GFUD01051021.1.p1 GENE.GFUD01051021.1~~GFUD01051021.1.p1  ORF type:complete len:100 (+),score=0.83 GFUD01051021.1:311-610(+)
MSLLRNCIFQLRHAQMCSYTMCPNRATLPHIRLCQTHANAICDRAGKIRQEPKRTKRGEIFKFFFTVGLGLLIGSSVSRKFAAFLEENELFVPEDDDVD